jgi:hypothetical protein
LQLADLGEQTARIDVGAGESFDAGKGEAAG